MEAIVVDRAVFIAKKAHARVIVNTKLTTILTQSCFHDTPPPHKNDRYPKNVVKRPIVVKNVGINTYLNTLNAANYKNVLKKILYTLNGKSSEYIVSVIYEVFEKAVIHAPYIETYVMLIRDLGCIEYNIFYSKFNSLLNTAIQQLPRFDIDVYDEFCEFIKVKNRLVNANKIILLMLNCGEIKCTCLRSHVENIIGMLSKHVETECLQHLLIPLINESKVFLPICTLLVKDFYQIHKTQISQ
jgi:hypothetical protein